MEKPIKILSLIPYRFLPPVMGGEKGIAFFYRYLAPLLPVCCIITSDNKPEGDEGYRMLPLLNEKKAKYINPILFFRLKRIIKEEQITHLILEHPYYGWLGILLKRICRVKLIIHSHNIEALRFKDLKKWWWGILWNYEKWTHRGADHSFFIQDNDMQYALKRFRLKPEICSVITYGINRTDPPSIPDKQSARQELLKLHNIPEQAKILLFNGSLYYLPNLEALDNILEEINPRLLAEKDFNYRIVICGTRLPERYNQLKAYRDRNIIFAGFVEDINLYFSGADILINPVIEGGGIKTKVVEALAQGLSVVSTKSGSIGIPEAICGGKLKLSANDNDWIDFTDKIRTTDTALTTPASFYDHFYWGNIAGKAAGVLRN